MGYEIPDELMELARGLMDLYEIAYHEVEPQVSYIINNRIRDINMIEHMLDRVMDIPTEKGYKLFLLLCEYVATIDKEVADDYLKIYKELYGDDEITPQKK